MSYSIKHILHSNQLFLIAGPCVIESHDTCRQIVEELLRICSGLNLGLIFKSSYRKANRTSLHSFAGIGDDQALEILQRIKLEYELPVTTDVHEIAEVNRVAQIVDLIQVPAFLCRQTELLQTAGATGIPVNIKKGQFMANAAISCNADGLFIETHPRPETSRSDGKSMLPLDQMGKLMEEVIRIRKAMREIE